MIKRDKNRQQLFLVLYENCFDLCLYPINFFRLGAYRGSSGYLPDLDRCLPCPLFLLCLEKLQEDYEMSASCGWLPLVRESRGGKTGTRPAQQRWLHTCDLSLQANWTQEKGKGSLLFKIPFVIYPPFNIVIIKWNIHRSLVWCVEGSSESWNADWIRPSILDSPSRL